MKHSRKARLKVKFLVMDMNASYGQLLKTVFPNAEIVTDRFHIIQHINKSFNL
ncbi:transposase [Vagococcus carniphilus]|uniref:transposase n=1 Tax=Vagococcus carniphilus TaxID=218144 RepID=UPI003BA8CE9C